MTKNWRTFARWLGSRIVVGVAARVVACVLLAVVAGLAVAFLWELSLVFEGMRDGRLADPDGQSWFLIWLMTVAGRSVAIVIVVGSLVVLLWEWLRDKWVVDGAQKELEAERKQKKLEAEWWMFRRRQYQEHAAEMLAGIQDDAFDVGELIDRVEARIGERLDRARQAALDRTVTISDLMPVELEGHSLGFALRILCRRAQEDGFVVERDIQRVGDVLDAEGCMAAFRIVQEALNNARQHSEAGRATVRYWQDDLRICAEVSDAGAGFSPDDLEPHLLIGLTGMRERSRILGGRLTVSSSPGAGTSVLLEVPVRPDPPSQEGPE